jgi:UDP-N-acetyl-D-glucosamine dehydrogenase
VSDPLKRLASKIADRTCRYGVIGLGYVGLPLAIAFTKRGVSVLGFEVDASKVKELLAGRSYIPDVPAADVAAARAARRLDATTDFARLAECDVISICVPTPLSKSRDPDVSYVAAATESVRKTLRPGQLVVLESTTYPGMTDEFLRPPLEKGGLVTGRDIAIAFSPERVDPGNTRYGVENTPKVVGGCGPVSTRLAADFYRIAVEKVVEVSSAAAAEMAKLLENTFRSVNIALVNEVAIMCDRLGLDVREVVDAAASKPFGYMAFQPGPGTGGHCIPLDPLYLSWKLRTLEYRARFVELADDVNLGMPRYVVERAATALNEERKSLKGAKVLVLGVAYKRDVDDVRESPSLEIIRHLERGGAVVEYADPHIPVADVHGTTKHAVPVDAKTLPTYDCVVVATDHRAFPWDDVAAHARLIVDARGAVPRAKVRGTLWPLSGPAVRGTAPAAGPGKGPARSKDGARA